MLQLYMGSDLLGKKEMREKTLSTPWLSKLSCLVACQDLGIVGTHLQKLAGGVLVCVIRFQATLGQPVNELIVPQSAVDASLQDQNNQLSLLDRFDDGQTA